MMESVFAEARTTPARFAAAGRETCVSGEPFGQSSRRRLARVSSEPVRRITRAVFLPIDDPSVIARVDASDARTPSVEPPHRGF
jgi:hypothetical protein